MIYSVKGELIFADPTFVVVECGGVGMKCFVSTTTLTSLTSIGTQVSLFTYMSVREDAIDLYGFSTANELEAFKLLISISGVGPKAAMSILSALPPNRLSIAISSGDVKSIQSAQGVGKKTAERIVLELKDKMGVVVTGKTNEIVTNISSDINSDNISEAIEVLVSLGYSQSDATVAVGGLDVNLSVDELIRKALKILSANL